MKAAGRASRRSRPVERERKEKLKESVFFMTNPVAGPDVKDVKLAAC